MGNAYLSNLISTVLYEDIKTGDITTNILFPRLINIKAEIIAKEDGVICGLQVVEKIFKTLNEKIRVIKGVKEGSNFKKGQTICIILGDARAILSGERTALNFLGRLSGIAALTRKYVNAVKPYKVKIMDTRKTTPGLRELEKYAVECGGGVNHRMGLYDQVLIKDNHIAVFRGQGSGNRKSLKDIIEEVKKGIKRDKEGIKIEIEVENLREFQEALDSAPDIIMLDNMSISNIKKAVKIRNSLPPSTFHLLPKLEVSGGVTLDNVRSIAAGGVDMISVGALTHSARSLDFSLEIAE
jgi:nicotinate-nucleotide pyrophosphorylase (carboxylating)